MRKLTLLAVVCFVASCVLAQSPRILVPYRAGTKWGFCDTLGRIRIQPRYDSVSLFAYGATLNGAALARVMLNKKEMLINDKGAIMVPPKYDRIGTPFILGENFAFIVSKDKHLTVYTKNKELSDLIYEELFMIEPGYFQVGKEKKWGVMDADGKIKVPVVCDNIWSGGTSADSIIIHTEQNGKVVSYSFKRIGSEYFDGLPPAMEMLETMLPEAVLRDTVAVLAKQYGLDSVQLKNRLGIVYKNGKQGVLLPEQKKVYFFSKTYDIRQLNYLPDAQTTAWSKGFVYIVASRNSKYGMLNEKEAQILPFQYDSIEEKDGFFLLRQNDKVGFFISNTFYPIIRPAYDQFVRSELVPVNYRWSFTLFEVRIKNKRGFVGENGRAFFKN